MSENHLFDYSTLEVDEDPKKKTKKSDFKRTTLYEVEESPQTYTMPMKRKKSKNNSFITKKRLLYFAIGTIFGLLSWYFTTDSFGQTTLYPLAFGLLILLSYLVTKDSEITLSGFAGYIFGSYGIVLLFIAVTTIAMFIILLLDLLFNLNVGGIYL